MLWWWLGYEKSSISFKVFIFFHITSLSVSQGIQRQIAFFSKICRFWANFGDFWAKMKIFSEYSLFCLFLLEMENIMQKHSPKNFSGHFGYIRLRWEGQNKSHFLAFFWQLFFQALVKSAGIKIGQKFWWLRSGITYVYHQKKFHAHTPKTLNDEKVSWVHFS